MGKEVMRELFMEELTAVSGGQPVLCPDCWHTTMACCEEGPFDGCCSWWHIDDIISIDP
ncbi:MAG TPA: hypothetical protein VHI71_00875 [Actinomycetota bacterium]|nr:hypothetical protein [Actinomycetota bacterium]